MTIKSEPRGNATVLHLSGEIREADEDQFISTVTKLIDRPGARVVLDMSEITYVTSAGLGAMVRVTAQANTQRAKVVIGAPSPFVSGVLEITALNRYFDVYPTIDDAAAASG
jgi:anti-sigma B factor antagonist